MSRGTNRLIGARVRRREDPRFLRGRGRYVTDLNRPGMLHVAFYRSDVPHAWLKSLDVDAARAVPGVVDVFTASDLSSLVRPISVTVRMPGYQGCDHPVLADRKVCFAGQPIAAVVANSRYEAEDGVDAVAAEYELLPPVLDVDSASEAGAATIHPSVPDNLFNHFTIAAGDVEGAFAAADHVVEVEIRNGRCAQVPLECRVIAAEWDELYGELSVNASHQAPHILRTGLAEFLDIPESSIRITSPDVGGGFGGKLTLYPEDLVTCAVSRLVGRPVRWASDRREDLLTTLQGREQVHRVSAAVDDDGKVRGLRVAIKASNGAFPIWPMSAGLDSGQASENVPGPYDISNYERDVYAVATNKAPMGPYRGVGRVAACFAIERTMDEIANRLHLDPLEVRRRNVVRSYPHETPTGLRFESGSSAEALDEIERILDLEALRRQHLNLRSRRVYRGVGFAAIVEHTALGPQEVSRKGIDMVLGMETACIRVEPDGAVTVLLGTHSQGQGHETSFAQVVADELEIPLDRIRVRFGDTSAAPYGLGTWASRSLVYGGGAAILASRDVVRKAIDIAAHRFDVSAESLVFRDGAVCHRSDASVALTLDEIALIANHRANQLPEHIDPGLEATRRYRAPDPGSFSNALHAAVVEVNIRTGIVEIQRYVVIEDCGTMVNPTIVEGQLQGGVAQGIGQALLEQAVYDENGHPRAVTLADYLVPVASDVPRMEIHHLESPSPDSLGGFKGMGEGGAVNPPAAIANAVTDALSPFGIKVNHTPILPDWIVDAVELAERGSM